VRRAYSLYVAFMFLLLALIVVPSILILYYSGAKRTALGIHPYWAKAFFFLIFIPVEIEYQFKPDKNGRYIFCSNHFSFVDIPVMAFLPNAFKYIGKSSITKVPLFGYMFKKIHIPVNRSDPKSRLASLKASKKALIDGFSLAFFPEGGIMTKEPPNMVRFKDGAFRLSLDHQVPIVPVTLPFDHEILPDDNKFLFRRRKCKIIIHQPIFPQENNVEELARLKNLTFDTIDKELKKHFPKPYQVTP